MGDYLYPHDHDAERARLATLAALWDPTSTGRLAGLGVGPGWRCLEVGAGAGSLTDWLAARVGPKGRVVATDVDTTNLDSVASDVVETMVHDVTTDPLPQATFDLVHTRLLIKHLTDREAVLARLVAALRPGGWLVVEEPDWTPVGLVPPDPSFEAVVKGLRSLMEAQGASHDYGRELFGAFRRLRLEEVEADGTYRMAACGTADVDFFRLTFERVRERLISAELLDADTYARAQHALDAPDRSAVLPVLVSATGRKR